jgi:hypothetical protein
MRVWITKYALTKGIKEVEGEACENTLTDMFDAGKGEFYHRLDWHKTREEALKHAEWMRVKKIKSLTKQIDKLKEKVFK